MSDTLSPMLRSLTALLGSILIAGSAGAVPDVGFPYGVASGDITPFSAVLWTRVDTATPIKVEVSKRLDFRGRPAFKRTIHPSTAEDLTVSVLAVGLKPATTYYYRFRHGSAKSVVGTFTTAPNAHDAANVSFAFTADTDYLQQLFDGNHFEVFDAIAAEDDLDFWVYLGDTIYSDSSLRPLVGLPLEAETLDQYREVYRENRALPALTSLFGSLPSYVVWDDHEVRNDYSGQTVDPLRYANGRKAFFEYMPTTDEHVLEDPTCAGDPVFRTYQWGSEVEIFVLDERSCRSADAQVACATSPVTADLAPTLPELPAPYNFRTQFRAILLSAGLAPGQVDLILPLAPSATCLGTIYDSGRTVLGPVQKQALKDALLASTANFKVIVNEYPIFQFYALPYDRWESYAAERAELLTFIRDQVPGQTFFATTDTHANLIAPVAVDRFLDPSPVAMDFVTGPVAAFTYEEILAAFAGEIGVPPAVALIGFHAFLNVGGVQCRNLNVDSYGRVDLDPVEGTVRVELRDASGMPVLNANPFDPFNVSPCTWTLGPAP